MIVMSTPLKDLEAFLNNVFEDKKVHIITLPANLMRGKKMKVEREDERYSIFINDTIPLDHIVDTMLEGCAIVQDWMIHGVSKEERESLKHHRRLIKHKYYKYTHANDELIINGEIINLSQ